MRIAIAQINSTLADFNSNKEKIIQYIQRASEKKAELIIFPEASLFGYHPFDLLERKELVKAQLKVLSQLIKKIPKDVFVLVGGFEENKCKKGRPYFNSAFLCTRNKIIKSFQKELLPTGDVFDEARFIEKGSLKNNFFQIKNKKFFVSICEDIWAWEDANGCSIYTNNPLQKVPKKKIDLVINLSSSPYFSGKFKQREYVVAKTAKYFKAPMVYVNMVGGQDEIIYDGQSFLTNSNGKVEFICQSFVEDLNVFELPNLKNWNAAKQKNKETETEQLHKALVLGIQDFVAKNSLKSVHLGLSGGIDSAVLACLASDALGPQNVKLFALPTEFNHQESFDLAKKLSANLQIELNTVSIQTIYQQIRKVLDDSFKVEKFQLMHENIQSRIRGLVLMAYSNLSSSLLLTTGNKSEYATGYATLYGDMCGGLAPLGDLTKKQVYDLANFYNAEYELIPKRIINRPPTAELRPNQKDQDSLPEYELLDRAVEKIVEKRNRVKTKTEKWLLSSLYRTEFKRWQAPPILKISEHSFGRGRRYPITHKANLVG